MDPNRIQRRGTAGPFHGNLFGGSDVSIYGDTMPRGPAKRTFHRVGAPVGNRKNSDTPGQGENLGSVVIEDLRRTRLGHDYKKELEDLYHFYLDDESRARLERKSRLARGLTLLWLALKGAILKLSPLRRIALLLAMLLTFVGPAVSFDRFSLDLRPTGFVLLLILLMLELKDKLLARDEIEIARQVQLALLPDEHPELPGWSVWSCSRPANDVGGDLVDYIELDGFRHGIVLGDVAGKGLGAALLTSKLQATLRALVPETITLDELGNRVNTIFHRDGLDNRYATLFYAVLEYHSGHLGYLNAGHNPPFVIRSDRIDKLEASSVPLGMFGSTSYEEGGVELQPGDMLVAYSDGLTEASNSAGEEFGVERLEVLLPQLRDLEPEAVGQRLLDEVDRFLGDARANDDLSLVVISKK